MSLRESSRAWAVVGCVWAAGVGACSSESPRTSGSKTNWFTLCDTDLACGEEGACICGFCTLPCSSATDCEAGRCGSELASAGACAQTAPSRLCLPTEAEPGAIEAPLSACSEIPLEVDPDLGDAAPSCDIDGALVCESFDAPVDPTHSVWIEGDIEAELQDCVVHSGAGAVRYAATGADGEAFAQTRYRFPEPVESGLLHARLFTYVPSTTTLPEQIILMELWNDGADFEADRITLQLRADGTPSAYVGVSDATVAPPSEGVLPRDEWVCLELSVGVGQADGSVSLSVNGGALAEQSALPTLGEAPFSIAVSSALFTEDTQAAEIFVDDFVVATAPIGCAD